MKTARCYEHQTALHRFSVQIFKEDAMRLLADEMDKAQSKKYHMTFETAARSYI